MKKEVASQVESKINSADLAALIVDALLRSGLLGKEGVEKAIAIAAEEIDARKALGDY